MAKKLEAKNITVNETSDRRNLEILFTDNATVDMLEFVEKTGVGERPGAENDRVDLWDVERLNKRDGEGEGAVENDEE
jgi:hypothetical protein